MLWIGSGVIGGIGLGLGYISPVSTLVKWFPGYRVPPDG
jgi:OFA family oxalate/formate antiporter-like MFS transporter